MSEVARTLRALFRDWKEPRSATYNGAPATMRFRCRPNEPCPDLQSLDIEVPEDLKEFWSICCGCRLFEDATYGQWGLELFAPSESILETEKYRVERASREDPGAVGDLIVGRFIGDLEFLLIRCDSREADYGRVLVVAEIDPRGEWAVAAPNFHEFLTRYASEQGAKYWEAGTVP